MRSSCLLALILIAFAGVAASQPIRSASGNAYNSDGQLLFRQTHYWYADTHGKAHGLTVYSCPDGHAFARRLSDYGTHPATPDFSLEDAQTGYEEGVRTKDGQRTVYVRRGSGMPESGAPLPAATNAVIDDGFNAYVAEHWQSLLDGHKVPIQYLVPSRHTFYRFLIVKVDGAAPGELRLRMQFDYWFGRFLPHVYVVYDVATRDLIRYEGISNIRDSAGDNVSVRIESPSADHHDNVPSAQLDTALIAPLDGHCTL